MKLAIKQEAKRNTYWIWVLVVFMSLLLVSRSHGATYTSNVATGNWSNSGTWSPVGVPGSGDNVIIHGGQVITVDTNFSCNNLTIGDATSGNTTLQITVANHGLTVNGALSINPNNINKIYTLNAGPGNISISGTFPTWSATGTTTIEVSTGTLTFAPAVSITSANQNITFTGAGTISFNSSFTDSYDGLTPHTGCIVNFAGSYTVNTTPASWAGKGTAVFANTGTITATSNLTLFNLQTASSASTTLASAAGTVIIGGAVTIGSGSTFTASENFELDGNWTNSGGTFNGGSNTVTLNGTTTVTGVTAFPNLQIGSAATSVTVSVTLNNSIACTSLTYNASSHARTVTASGGDTLTVNGNLVINQPAGAVTNSLAANTGTCIITGSVTFNGTTLTASYISKIVVTTGLLNIAGAINYAANTTAANQVITVTSTGTITLGSALNLTYGTLSITSTGTVNFNGSSPSFTFGSGNSPVFTTTNGCTLNFAAGFVNNYSAITLAATSNSVFTGNGAITSNAAITFGNVQFNASDTLASKGSTVDIAGNCTLASGSAFNVYQNFELTGNWSNGGGTMSGSADTIILIGTGTTISGSSSTTFPVIQLGNAASAAVSYTMNNNNSCTGMIFYAGGVANTFTLGTGDTLSVNGNVTINQPTAAVTNNLLVNAGVCDITGIVYLPGTTTTASYISKITVTSGSLNITGNVSWGNNATAGNAVITASTGTLTFGSSMTMASGTLSVTSTGTINFNGTSPSFTLGSGNGPVFTTTNGCTINIAGGFVNTTTALTLAATSNCVFTGKGTIAANTAITFGNTQFDASDTLASTGSAVDFAGNVTLASGSLFDALQSFELGGNWTNNGGSMTGSNDTIFLTGNAKTIGGTSETTFPFIQMGNAATTTVAYTMNNSNSCPALLFYGGAHANSITFGNGDTLAVNGSVTINQPTAAVTNNLLVNGGICIITGNLNLPGTAATANYIAKVTVTSGNLSITGSVTLGNNTRAANAVITVSVGTITFNTSLTMASGTLSVTGTGTINFNGPSVSFTFGGTNAPKFTTTNGCNLNFVHGFVNNTTALVIAATSTSNFTNTGTITPNAKITFGNVAVNSSDTLAAGAGAVIMTGNFTLASGSLLYAEESFEVDGNWTNNGGTLSGTAFTVFLNGTAQTVSGNSTTFQTLEIGNTTTAVNVAVTMNNNNSCSALILEAGAHNRTLTLGSGVTLTVNGNLTINQPTANNMTSLLEVATGTCSVSGNLIFSGANSSATRIGKIDVTSGLFTMAGTLTWGGSTSTATNVIAVNTGTLTFNSSVTMGTKSGTIGVTGSGTVNFNGTSVPSLSFGGAVAPVLSANSGSTINFKDGFTTNTTSLIFNAGSNILFTGTGTLTPNAAITFGNIGISTGATLTLAGNISVTGNWTDSGTVTPSTSMVTFNGSGTQTIIRTGGSETFYGLTSAATGAILQLMSNLTINSALNMNGANINMNGYTLTLGNGSGASLSYVGGIAYGGTWKRWFPATAITDSTGPQYGLFPLGTSTDYRYVKLNSTVNPTTPGYVSASHTNVTGATPENYTDNGGSLIEEIANMHSDLSTSALVGGTYNIAVHFTGFSTSGNVSDLKLETYTGGVMGSAGTHVATTGLVSTPTMQRTGLSAAQLSNSWVLGTNDKNATPLYSYYYSRKTGNWNDTTTGNGTWTFTTGGVGPSCDCYPISGGYAIVDSSNTVTVNVNNSIEYIDISNGGTLVNNSSNTFTVSGNLTLYGTGTFTNNGTISVTGALILPAGSSPSSNGNMNVSDELVIDSGGSYSQTAGTLTLNGDVIDSGTITISSGAALTINGAGSVISGGTATINGSAGSITITNNKSISSGTILTIGTSSVNMALALASGTTVSNGGNVTLNGNMTGAASSSSWINNAQSTLTVTGNVLATGVLDASTGPNTVNYSGSGSQAIASPLSSYYNLTVSNSGTKTLAGAAQVDNALTLSGSVILDESTNVISGNGSLNMSGTSELKLQRSIENIYPELTGIYSLTGGTVLITQTADSATVAPAQYYNLYLNGTTPFDISGITVIGNNFNMQGSSTLNNNNALSVAGTFTYNSPGYTTLSDNIAVNGLALDSGTLDDGGLNITVNGAGGWNNNGGTFNTTGQTIFLSGSGVAQNIGGTAGTTFNNLSINNPGNVTLNVSPAAATSVTGNLSLTSGNLITNSTNILEMLDTSSVSNGSASSYVSGPMMKVGNSDFIFPTGKNGVFGQAGISGMINSNTAVTAEYFNNSYSTLTPMDPLLSQVSHTEYWNISRTVTSDSLQLQLFWANANNSDIIDCTYLTMALYNGSEWVNESAAALSGSVCSGTGSGSAQTTGYMNSFGPFAFGSSGGGHALPIELLSFNATPGINNSVLTNWSTAIEINNNYFTVERSSDATNFAGLAQIEAAGNSTTQKNYEWTDETPLQGISYYRLRQTDFNGNSTYSDIVSVNLEPVSGITLYPNPAHNNVFLTIANPTGEMQCKIYDIDGRLILNHTLETENGNSALNLAIPIENIPAGMYLVSVSDIAGTIYRQKLIIK